VIVGGEQLNIDTDSLVTFIIMWGIPTFMVFRAYIKMNTDDKKSAMSDFKSRHFISTIGFLLTGAFFAQIGALFSISIMKVMGIVLLVLSGFFSMLDMWKKSKIKSICILVLLSFVIFLNVT